jgi:PhnB protein
MVKPSMIAELDRAIEAMLRGGAAPAARKSSDGAAGDERLESLVNVAEQLRDLPSEKFRMKLKADLQKEANVSSPAQAEVPRTWIPEGFRTVTPYLISPPAAEVIEFLKTVFGATEKGRYNTPDGKIMHAEVLFKDCALEISDGSEQHPPRPAYFIVSVENADESYAKAIAAGATAVYEPTVHPWGDRDGGVQDVGGNYWFITTRRVSEHAPADQATVITGVNAHNAANLIEFWKAAFGAEDFFRHDTPDGKVLHARVKFGDTFITIGEPRHEWPSRPMALHMYVPDVDAAYARAVAAGAEAVMAPEDKPYGERGAEVKDPMGNRWFLATAMPARS